MFNVTKDKQGNSVVVKFSGTIDETVKFEVLIGPPVPELVVVCKDVPRISSAGVKAWMKYFGGLTKAGTKLKFQDCSTSIVEQFNFITNFGCGGEVESVVCPYRCTKCSTDLIAVFKVAELRKIQFALPDAKCTQCGAPSSFDDSPEDYFAFALRKQAS